MPKRKIRIGPRHPRLAAAGYELTRRVTEFAMERRGLHKANSDYAKRTLASIRERLQRGETVYIAGLAGPGMHNTGVALVEVTQSEGPRLIVNNEEERFSGNKHTTEYPQASLHDMREVLRRMGRDIGDIAAFVTTWDYLALLPMLIRTSLEEAPASLKLLHAPISPAIRLRQLDQVRRLSPKLGREFGLAEPLPLICMPHHDNHAWFSFAASPFADHHGPVAIGVLDGTGDAGSISLYVAENGEMKQLYCNDSLFDSLGAFYSVISSSQGGWTWLSSEGRYMGAAAWGDMNRATNPYYQRLKEVLQLGPDGKVHLNREMANWYCDPVDNPYKAPLIEILGPPLREDQLWNPDAMLRVEDIHHRPDTKDRLDKAAATQMVFEDAMIHVVDHLLRITGTDRLILTGGVALNALANMRLLEHFDEAWFAAAQQRKTRLHLWVPPVPGDPGVPIGAAWLFSHMAGAPRGKPLSHAFYCGLPPTHDDITAALKADDVASIGIGSIVTPEGRDAIADLMAFMVAQGGVIAIYQGAAETGPRALGHRSILANPCDPEVRERLNERVKYREAIRPLAPMATLEAARDYFVLEDGASDDGYNAYYYMVLTAHSKPQAREKIPAVVHADGTGRIQVVRPDDDPLTYAYLKALGRRIGIEMSVNTSFNVAGPIAQTPAQAMDTLRRSNGLDVVVLVADDGVAYAAWHGGARDSGRFTGWYADWKKSRG
ncbi:carbamoyltransferase C-terminal domain-containing protein [Bradyrhizobium genosp. P]|uniref:carbamoyltransferase C-terminal domain-containing protein n=1 Tax=Bradyrhizobium genosp. P TaxID=83641 RepID=UPI003CE74F98